MCAEPFFTPLATGLDLARRECLRLAGQYERAGQCASTDVALECAAAIVVLLDAETSRSAAETAAGE